MRVNKQTALSLYVTGCKPLLTNPSGGDQSVEGPDHALRCQDPRRTRKTGDSKHLTSRPGFAGYNELHVIIDEALSNSR